ISFFFPGPPSPTGFPPSSAMSAACLAFLFALSAILMMSRARPENRPHVERTLRLWGRMLALVALGWVFGLLPGGETARFNLLFAGRWYVFAGFFLVWTKRQDTFDLSPAAKRVVWGMVLALVGVLAVLELASVILVLWGYPWQTLTLYGVAIAAIAAA